MRYDTCQVMRRVLVKHYTLESFPDRPTSEEWETKPCGTPLFDEEGEHTGRCPSCRSGWRVDTNFPVDASGHETH